MNFSNYENMDTMNNNLENKFNETLIRYNNLYSNYLNKIQNKTLNIQNNPDLIYNAYVNKSATPSEPNFIGCFGDDIQTMMIHQNDGVFSYEECKLRAADTGSNFFALENTNDDGLGQCYTSNAILKENLAEANTLVNIWTSNTFADNVEYINLFEFGFDGVMYLLNKEKRIIWSTKSDLSIPNNCPKDNLPFINSIVATFNSVCFGDGSTDDSLLQLNNEKITDYYKEKIPDNTQITNFQSLKDYITQPLPVGDYSLCSTKDLNVSYKCGNSLANEIKMDDYKNDEIVPFDCTSEKAACTFFMRLEDNGDLNVYNGDYQDDSDAIVVYSTNTGISDVKPQGVNIKLDLQKFPRNFMLPGETLKKGEYLFSENGAFALTLLENNNLTIIYISDPCTNFSDKNIDKGIFKLFETKNANNNKLGKVIHKNNENYQEFSNTDTQYINQYDTYLNFNSKNNEILSIEGIQEDECMVQCNKLTNCGGFVYNNKDNVCSIKNENTFPLSIRKQENNFNLHSRLKNVKENRCNYNYKNIDSGTLSNLNFNEKKRKINNCNNKIISKKDYKKLLALYLELKKLANQIKEKNKLNNEKFDSLKQDKIELVKKIKKDLKIIESYSNKNSTNTDINYNAMENDSMKLLLRNNYEYLLISILAIVVVYGCISLNKK